MPIPLIFHAIFHAVASYGARVLDASPDAAPQLAIAPLIGAALISAISAVAGGLLGKKSTATQSQSTARTLPPELQGLQGDLIEQLRRRLQYPDEGIEPVRADARNKVNANYAGADQALRDRYTASGGGRSGKLGMATRQTELGRIGSLSGLEGDFSRLKMARRDSTVNLAQQFLGNAYGSNTQGAATTPGTVAGSTLASGASSLTSLLTLQTLKSILGGASGGAQPAGVNGYEPGQSAADVIDQILRNGSGSYSPPAPQAPQLPAWRG